MNHDPNRHGRLIDLLRLRTLRITPQLDQTLWIQVAETFPESNWQWYQLLHCRLPWNMHFPFLDDKVFEICSPQQSEGYCNLACSIFSVRSVLRQPRFCQLIFQHFHRKGCSHNHYVCLLYRKICQYFPLIVDTFPCCRVLERLLVCVYRLRPNCNPK